MTVWISISKDFQDEESTCGVGLCGGDADAIHISVARGGILCESRVRASGDFGEYRTN